MTSAPPLVSTGFHAIVQGLVARLDQPDPADQVERSSGIAPTEARSTRRSRRRCGRARGTGRSSPLVRPTMSQEVVRHRWSRGRTGHAPRSSRWATRWTAAPASRASPWSRGAPCPGTGAPGRSGTPRMSREIRPSTRRSGPVLPATSLITTRNTAWPCALAPVRIVTDEPERADLDAQVGQLLGVDHGGLGVAHPGGQVAGQVDGLGLAGFERRRPGSARATAAACG